MLLNHTEEQLRERIVDEISTIILFPKGNDDGLGNVCQAAIVGYELELVQIGVVKGIDQLLSRIPSELRAIGVPTELTHDLFRVNVDRRKSSPPKATPVVVLNHNTDHARPAVNDGWPRVIVFILINIELMDIVDLALLPVYRDDCLSELPFGL